MLFRLPITTKHRLPGIKALRIAHIAGVIWFLRRMLPTMSKLRRSVPAILTVFAIAFTVARAQQPAPPAPTDDYVRAHYTKYEYRIPMRDGKKLFTAVYVPKDEAGGLFPFLMDRTPYSVGPYGEDKYPVRLGPSDEFEKSGYIFVYQDVRGRWMSEGDFLEMRPHIDQKKSPQDVDDASDTSDTIDFLLKHVANNNGKVGIWGISYPGFYTSASIIDSHPALVAASPQAPMTDLFLGDDAYHGGAFMLAANFGFYASSRRRMSLAIASSRTCLRSGWKATITSGAPCVPMACQRASAPATLRFMTSIWPGPAPSRPPCATPSTIGPT